MRKPFSIKDRLVYKKEKYKAQMKCQCVQINANLLYNPFSAIIMVKVSVSVWAIGGVANVSVWFCRQHDVVERLKAAVPRGFHVPHIHSSHH